MSFVKLIQPIFQEPCFEKEFRKNPEKPLASVGPSLSEKGLSAINSFLSHIRAVNKLISLDNYSKLHLPGLCCQALEKIHSIQLQWQQPVH